MATFSKVVVVGVPLVVTPVFEQVESKLVRTLASSSRYPLTPDAKVTTERAEELPAQTPEAVEPFIWALQERHGSRGGAWQVDFYDPAGFSFMVVYLE